MNSLYFKLFNLLRKIADNERDLVILRHEFIVRWPDHIREEKSVDFVVYGTPASLNGHSAMALTVGCM